MPTLVSLGRATGAVIEALILLAEKFPENGGRFEASEIANFAGCDNSRATKALHLLEREGITESDRTWIPFLWWMNASMSEDSRLKFDRARTRYAREKGRTRV